MSFMSRTMELKFSQPLRVNDKHPFHFIVIGAGGTGGYFIPNLARLVASVNQKAHSKHHITLIDGDEVEEKNIVRQNFILPDIGKNKAEVLAHRYSSAFGLEIAAYPKYLENESNLRELAYSRSIFPVIIGCVDNNRTRQLVYNEFQRREYHMFWLDAGNEQYSGQVVFGYNYQYELSKPKEGMGQLPRDYFLPSVADLYPDIINDTDAKFNSELSCAARAVSAPQSITANLMAANILMNFVATMLTCGDNDGIRTHQVKFNTKNSVITTDLNYYDEIIEKTRACPTRIRSAS